MQIVPPAHAARMTRRYLAPIRDNLLRMARHYRQEADICLQKQPDAASTANDFTSRIAQQPYPIGYCRQIRDHVWDNLVQTPLVCSLRRQGIIWKKIYFIEKGRWFQNAIQCGNWILDVAHDTVNATDPPVICETLDEAGWENLDNWFRFAEIAVQYYRLTVYPNLYFPLLFPIIPFLAVRENGRLELLYCQQMLFLLDLGENWQRITALLDNQNLMDRTLPPIAEQKLMELANAKMEPFPVELRKCTPAELRQTLPDWDQIYGLPRQQLAATLQNFEKIAGLAARRLRQAEIRLDKTSAKQ